MRVLHVLWQMRDGGAERAVYQLVAAQRARGTTADVLALSAGGTYAVKCREAGARVHVLGQRHPLDFRVVPDARRILGGYHLAHFHVAEPLPMHVAAGLAGLRTLYTHRNGTRTSSLRRHVRDELCGRSLRRFAAVSGNTRHGAAVAASTFRLSQSTVLVTYNGLDFSLLEPHRPPSEIWDELRVAPTGAPVVGVVANLEDGKRVDRVIDALALMRSDIARCLVVGDGPQLGALAGQVERYGLTDRVWLVGRTSHVADYLQVMDAFVLPSGPEESFGNALVEAMASGIPGLIFDDACGLLEHVRDGRSGFVVEDNRRLASRLDQLFADPVARERLGACARRDVRAAYSLEAMLRGYDTMYDSLKRPERPAEGAGSGAPS